MVILYVAGERVGTLADAETLIPEYLARRVEVELRDEAGNPLGKFVPPPATPTPADVLARVLAIAALPEEPGGDPSVTGRDHDRVLYGGPGGAR
jgi:hypothetical protein